MLKSLSHTADCLGFVNRIFRHSKKIFLFYHPVPAMCWRPKLEFDFRVPQWVYRLTKDIHGQRHTPTSSVQTDGSCLPIQMNGSVNSPHFLGQNHQDWNIFYWLSCGTEHPISLTFPVMRKWWKMIFHIKISAFLRMRATIVTSADMSRLGYIIKAWLTGAISLSLPSN